MEERVIKKQKWDPWGGSTLIIKGINEESSLFFRVVCVNVTCSVTTLMSFRRIVKLPTGPSC